MIEQAPIRRVSQRWSRTVLVAGLAIVAVTVIAIVGLVLGRAEAAELGMCLMAIREAVGLVAGRPGSPGDQS